MADFYTVANDERVLDGVLIALDRMVENGNGSKWKFDQTILNAIKFNYDLPSIGYEATAARSKAFAMIRERFLGHYLGIGADVDAIHAKNMFLLSAGDTLEGLGLIEQIKSIVLAAWSGALGYFTFVKWGIVGIGSLFALRLAAQTYRAIKGNTAKA